jgi:hypothetical protein
VSHIPSEVFRTLPTTQRKKSKQTGRIGIEYPPREE